MSSPVRIQRKRTKGWRMPEGAVYVGRPTLFGNPWDVRDGPTFGIPPAERGAWVIAKYREELTTLGLLSDWGGIVSGRRWEALADLDLPTMADYARHLLRGRDLVCWCGLCDAHLDGLPLVALRCPECPPCHATVLLELANAS